MPPRISVFPKCYFDELADGRMPYAQWIRDAAALGGEGIEHYDGFFRSFAPADVDPIARAMERDRADHVDAVFLAGLHPSRCRTSGGARWSGRRPRSISRCGSAARHCRTLSGQRHPGLSRAEGVARTVEGICRSLDYAAQRDVVLCMENHYKDGTWRYPEFAQPEDIFLEILERSRVAALRGPVRPVERAGRRLRSAAASWRR